MLVHAHAVDPPGDPRERADCAKRVLEVPLEVVLQHFVGVAIEGPQHPVCADLNQMKARRPHGNTPLGEVFAVGVENLDTVIGAVVHEHPPGFDVNRHAVDIVHVAGARFVAAGFTPHAPIKQEVAIGVELGHARAVVPVGHVETAVARPRHERRPVEVRGIGTQDVAGPDRLDKLLAIVGELVDGVTVVIDDPDVLLSIVRADVHRVRPLEDLVPLRPLFGDVALRVDDDETVFPAGIDAELTIRRLRPPPDLQALRRVATGASGSGQCGGGVAAPGQSPDRELHARSKLRHPGHRRSRNVRQLAPGEQIHTVRALREDALRRSPGPVLVPRQRAHILRPVGGVIRAGHVLGTDGTRHGGKRGGHGGVPGRAARRHLSIAQHQACGQAHGQRQYDTHDPIHVSLRGAL